MARTSCPSNAVEQAGTVVAAWRKIDPVLEFGEVNAAGLEAALKEVDAVLTRIDEAKAGLIDLRNRRDRLIVSAWEMAGLARAGIKGVYGDDSSQYERVGGTRRSERKRPVRKRKT